MDKKKEIAPPSSNWAKLSKTLVPTKKDKNAVGAGKNAGRNSGQQRHRGRPPSQGVGRYVSRADFARSEPISQPIAGPSKITVEAPAHVKEDVVLLPAPSDSPLVEELRQMVAGRSVLNEAKKAPGNYLAIDCEMVGLGHLGSESALARVSLINYHGHVILDTFVQPREKVTDWRTWISGIRESDLVGAPEFAQVQKQVAELVQDRILVGHAIDNDLKVLLLSHPRPLIRDTQRCTMLREKAKNKHPGLKKLSQMELGIQIQKASHSSVTDARATMALYRLHKVEWERQLHRTTEAYRAQASKNAGKGKATESVPESGKRKRDGDEEDEDEEDGEDQAPQKKGKGERQSFPGGGRKGISSGLGLIVRRNGQRVDGAVATYSGAGGGAGRRNRESAGTGEKWWEQAAG
ncbi:hypothetical protein IAU60_002732 [Kwoniella sp. DSM 27419]